MTNRQTPQLLNILIWNTFAKWSFVNSFVSAKLINSTRYAVYFKYLLSFGILIRLKNGNASVFGNFVQLFRIVSIAYFKRSKYIRGFCGISKLSKICLVQKVFYRASHNHKFNHVAKMLFKFFLVFFWFFQAKANISKQICLAALLLVKAAQSSARTQQ